MLLPVLLFQYTGSGQFIYLEIHVRENEINQVILLDLEASCNVPLSKINVSGKTLLQFYIEMIIYTDILILIVLFILFFYLLCQEYFKILDLI